MRVAGSSLAVSGGRGEEGGEGEGRGRRGGGGERGRGGRGEGEGREGRVWYVTYVNTV